MAYHPIGVKVSRGRRKLNRTVVQLLLWTARTLGYWLLWTAVLVVGLLFYARFVEPGRIVVETVNIDAIRPTGLADPETYRIVFISDFDMRRPPGRFEHRVRKRVNGLQPHLIAIGGDLFGGNGDRFDPEVVQGVGDWLAGFEARDGVYLVWGEQELRRLDQVRASLPSNVTDLQNRAVIHSTGHGRIRVSGPGGMFSHLRVDERDGGWLRASWGRSLTVAPYRGPDAERWREIDVTSRIYLHDVTDSVGLAVLERPGRAGYRFRVVPERSEWALIRPGDLKWEGNTRDKSVFVNAHGDYLVRIRVEPAPEATRVRSKIWPATRSEPENWPIDFRDLREDSPGAGTVALISGVGWQASSRQGWDWVRVRDLDGVELMREDFDEAGRFDEMWENPGGRSDRVQATVVIGHDPRLMQNLPDTWRGTLDLVLAGHTHGGQVRLPFFGPLHLDRSLPREWSMGLTRLSHGRARLYVSRGLGVSGVPVRFLCPPEITLVNLTLRPRRPAE